MKLSPYNPNHKLYTQYNFVLNDEEDFPGGAMARPGKSNDRTNYRVRVITHEGRASLPNIPDFDLPEDCRI